MSDTNESEVLEVGDLATDTIAMRNVVQNTALKSFHTAYTLAFGCCACVSLYLSLIHI